MNNFENNTDFTQKNNTQHWFISPNLSLGVKDYQGFDSNHPADIVHPFRSVLR